MELLDTQVRAAGGGKVGLSPVLADLARREQYLAIEEPGRRFDLGVRYGLMMAQFALSLSGRRPQRRTHTGGGTPDLSRELATAAGVPAMSPFIEVITSADPRRPQSPRSRACARG